MVDSVTPSSAPEYFDDVTRGVFIEFYNYKRINPNELILNIFVPKAMKNELVEQRNSIHISIMSKDGTFIKYNYIITSREKSLHEDEIADRHFFSIFPRKLQILESHVNKLYNLGRDPELTEVCLMDNDFSIILFRDNGNEFHICTKIIWTWFNTPYLKKIGGKGYINRKLQLILYNKLNTSDLLLESLLEGS
jgi:hypothetical protein